MLQPLDLLKTRLQQGDFQAQIAQRGHGTGAVSRPLRKTGRTLQAAKLVLEKDGILGLWRGTTPTIARNVPGVALYFASLNQLRTLLPNTVLGNLTAGGTARSSVGLVLMPMTVIKTRMESSIYTGRTTILGVARDILSTQGIRGLFAGFWPTTLRDAPTAGLFLVAYEQARRVLVPIRSLPLTSVDAAAGALAAGFSTFATAPFDTIKTRRQLRPEMYIGIWQTAALIFRQESTAGFFRGVALRCVRKAASSGIAWSLYEGLIRKFA